MWLLIFVLVLAAAAVGTRAAIPASAPTAAPGRLVVAASFEAGPSEVDLQEAKPGRISTVDAPVVGRGLSLHFQVKDGDRWSQDVDKSRSEAVIAASRGYAPKEGNDYWHRWWFRIPASTPLPTKSGDSLHVMQSWASDLSGFFAGLTFRPDALTFDNRGGRVWSLPSADFKRDRWYKMLWHSHYSSSASKGYDELWVDDEKVGMKYAQTLAPTSTSYFKFGLYRMDYGQGTADLYFDGLRVATTRGTADPR